MPQHSLQLIELMEDNAAAQVAELEAILAQVEREHPAHHLLEQAIQGARDRHRALEAAWKAALASLANSERRQ